MINLLIIFGVITTISGLFLLTIHIIEMCDKKKRYKPFIGDTDVD